MYPSEENAASSAHVEAELFQTRFALLAEISSDGICVHRDERIVFANSAAVRWMGVDPAVGLIGRRVEEFVHGESYPIVERRLKNLRYEGDSAPPAEVVMGRPHKPARDVQVTSKRISWDGNPAIMTTFRDLSSANASAALKSEAALLDHINDAVIGVSPTGTVISWNAAAEAIYGRDAEQALHLPLRDAVGAPLDAERLVQRGGRCTPRITPPMGHHCRYGCSAPPRATVTSSSVQT